jgi:hypothetical protein
VTVHDAAASIVVYPATADDPPAVVVICNEGIRARGTTDIPENVR